MEKKTGVARSSASEGYIMKENMELWSHVQKNRVNNLEEGIQQLRSVFFGGNCFCDCFYQEILFFSFLVYHLSLLFYFDLFSI